MRRVERSAACAVSACSPSSSSASSSRLASTLVSGVRSSCEASATNSRWRSSVASVSPRAASSACEHSLQGHGQLGDLVVGLGVGQAPARVARALDLARGVGQLGDRAHRPLRHGQAGQQGENRPAEHAEDEEDAHARRGVVDVRERPGVEQEPFTDRLGVDHAQLGPVAELLRGGARRHREGGLRRRRLRGLDGGTVHEVRQEQTGIPFSLNTRI